MRERFYKGDFIKGCNEKLGTVVKCVYSHGEYEYIIAWEDGSNTTEMFDSLEIANV